MRSPKTVRQRLGNFLRWLGHLVDGRAAVVLAPGPSPWGAHFMVPADCGDWYIKAAVHHAKISGVENPTVFVGWYGQKNEASA